MLTVDSNMKPTLSGGPLNGLYEFAQLHFHWGDDDFHGGENQINNKQYPLELHIVLYKKDYADVNSALSHPDGLCVLGCLFEVTISSHWCSRFIKFHSLRLQNMATKTTRAL